jgi:Na+-driven multidrug efflux pump
LKLASHEGFSFMAFFSLAVGLTKSTAFFLGATHMAQITRKQNFVERYHDIWQLAYPTIVTMMLHNVMSIIDTMMVSQVSMAALAGVSLAQLVLATLFYLYRGEARSPLRPRRLAGSVSRGGNRRVHPPGDPAGAAVV